MLQLDHLAVSCERLEAGVAAVEAALGVPLGPGGAHAAMGTHNRLLHLGPGLYLEVIAIDPAAPPPGRARWFDLDSFTGPPRLTNWIARCDDLPATLAAAPAGTGSPLGLSRGDLRWQMAVPEDGKLPYGGAFPALISWDGPAHPARRLPDAGCRLLALEIFHPEARALRRALSGMLDDARVSIATADEIRLSVTIDTPAGRKVLR